MWEDRLPTGLPRLQNGTTSRTLQLVSLMACLWITSRPNGQNQLNPDRAANRMWSPPIRWTFKSLPWSLLRFEIPLRCQFDSVSPGLTTGCEAKRLFKPGSSNPEVNSPIGVVPSAVFTVPPFLSLLYLSHRTHNLYDRCPCCSHLENRYLTLQY